jgi:Uma2 family endonuclease
MKAASHLPGREPDVLFIANDNLDTLKATFIDGPADLAIEIVSPESRGRDRGDKFFEYEQGGVGEYWLIDSERPWAEFYVLENDRYVHVHTQQGIIQSASIDGFRLHTEWVFSDPLPPTLEILRRLSVI